MNNSNERKIERDVLYICHSYKNFQKDSIEKTSKFIKNVNVFVRTNPIAEISYFFPIHQLEGFKKSNKLDLKFLPRNVSVFTTPIIYAPIDSQYKKLGNLHFRAAEKVIKKNHIQFDFIHSHFTWSAGYVGVKLKEEYHVPHIVTAHGYDIYSLPFKDKEWREKIEYVLNNSDHIITVSNSNLAFIKQLNVFTPITIIPNGFSADLFYPRNPSQCRSALNIAKNKKIILTVGNLEPVKGQKYLIEAIKTVLSERKDVLCIILGTGRLHKSLHNQIRLLGLEDYIMLIGRRPHDEIPLWINACDLFILPSLNEGNPTVMFEALGCGKPFVGTSVGGVPEIITSDTYGLLVKPADPKDLAEKILLALDREWDQKAILAYAKQFTWENIAKEILHVYFEVLK